MLGRAKGGTTICGSTLFLLKLIIRNRVTLAFEKLTAIQACMKFSRGVGRPVHFVHGPIEIEVSVPSGYREHLETLQETLGDKRAPYFGSLEYPQEARSLWGGYRRLEEYACEVFSNEEAAKGRTWMYQESLAFARYSESNDESDDDGDVVEEGSPGSDTNLITPSWTPETRTPFDHSKVDVDDFFFNID